MALPLVYHQNYSQVLLPERHPFPMTKFALLRDVLLGDGVARAEQFHSPEPADDALLALAHTPDYVQRFTAGELDAAAIRRQGFPWSPALVTRSRTAVGGTRRTAELALEHGLACHLAGGTHHAHADFGSGYCLLNDLAVTAAWAVESGTARRVLIVDCDVHQGDGTARIFEDDDRVFTLSVHAASNFPARKAISDMDVALPRGTGDADYLPALHQAITTVLAEQAFDLVLYDAGADVHADDRLGHFELSDTGMAQRDRLVISTCLQRDLPVACVIGGGYDRDVPRLARRHSILHREATACFKNYLSAA